MHTQRQFGMAVLGLAALALLLAGSGQARAEFIITFSQDGPNVVATGTGSLNLSGLTRGQDPALGPLVAPTAPSVVIGQAGSHPGDEASFTGVSGPPSFGTGPETDASNPFSAPGLLVGIHNGGQLVVASYYLSGHSLTSGATWDSTTISGLGLTPGTYKWTWGSVSAGTADDLIVQVGPAAASVPEPASLTLLATGALGLLGYGIRRRRQAAA